jgi:hypothetical protein
MTMPANDPGPEFALPEATRMEYNTQPPLPVAPTPNGLADAPEIPEVRW